MASDKSQTSYADDRQRDILHKCGIVSLDDTNLMEWGWSHWTPVIEKLLERIEALEKAAQTQHRNDRPNE